ncbi:MAG: shikimate dehydrogenase [Limisphaerales bacterium]|nr:MAG: shikimate dehydrogenase [Limisphaerales bacterium]KAG0507433.1 MAG: shikimate dehydrogenase [Limisphaerales bacterium]TXT51444.1 MAG: shikimate dehydrogenase [Limisphaerales bacterium]
MPANFLPSLVGSMSVGAAGNPTVAMVEAAFCHHGLHWRYVNMEVPPAGLADAVRGARAMGFRGFNLSMPHKVAVIPLLDGVGESAALIGAVNCVVRRGEQLIGENTDGKGFLKSLQEVCHPRGKNIVMFGAGGAARAVAVEIGLVGAKHITVVNRGEQRGRNLTDHLGKALALSVAFVPWADDFTIPADTDIVINATSIGLYDAEARLELNLDSLKPNMVVADVVFSPPQTRLLRDAAARGCRTLDGLGMLVNQGVIGVQYWTGVNPDPAAMRRALEEAMGV